MSNPWKLQKSGWKDSRPLGKKVYDYIMENTQWVVYLRRDPTRPCVICRDPASSSPGAIRVDCPGNCWGTGVKIDLQLAPCRIDTGNAELSFLEGTIRIEPGWAERSTLVGFFPRIVYPREEDIILLCEWKKPAQRIAEPPKGRPQSLIDVFTVKQVNPQFEREVGWFECGLKSDNVEYKLYEEQLFKMVDLRVIEKWQQKSYW